jgi:hypothetical protein
VGLESQTDRRTGQLPVQFCLGTQGALRCMWGAGGATSWRSSSGLGELGERCACCARAQAWADRTGGEEKMWALYTAAFGSQAKGAPPGTPFLDAATPLYVASGIFRNLSSEHEARLQQLRTKFASDVSFLPLDGRRKGRGL